MGSSRAEIIFPEEKEFRLKEELLWKFNLILKFRGFDDNRKIIWLIAVLLKALVAVCVSVFAYQVRHEPNKLAACVATCPAIYMAILKLLYMHFYRERIQNFFVIIEEEFWDIRIAGPGIENLARRRFLFINMMLTAQIITAIIFITFLNTYPLVDAPEGIKQLPNPMWIPFNTNPSPLHEILYAFLIWNQALTFLGNAIFDLVYIYAIQHLCVQFSLLRELLGNITYGIMPHASDLEKFNSEYFQMAVMKRLKICIKHHSKLLQYGKSIDTYTSSILVPQFIMTFVTLVVNGYIISDDQFNIFTSFELASFTSLMFSELIILAVQASDLKEQSVSVVTAITQSKWYLFKAPIKRILIILMVNAGKGIIITIGGMIYVDNPLIIGVLHKVFSTITLLKALISDAALSNNE